MKNQLYILLSIVLMGVCLISQSCSSEDPKIPEDPDSPGEVSGNDVSLSISQLCTEWSADINKVESAMSRYSVEYTSDPSVRIYRDSRGNIAMSYIFANDKLQTACIIFPCDNENKAELQNLFKDYNYLADIENSNVYYNTDKNTIITFSPQGEDYYAIGFAPIQSELYEYVEALSVDTEEGIEIEPMCVNFKGFLHGAPEPMKVGFYLGFSPTFEKDTFRKISSNSTTGPFEIRSLGIFGEQEYYYRAYAVYNGVEYLGETKSFVSAPITYSIDGRSFKIIKVEGGPEGDFGILQTEIPGDATFEIDGINYTIDDNGDDLISAYEMRSFILEISKSTGLPWRFPTTDEWQFAAKGGAKTAEYKYSGSNNLDEVAWFVDNSNGCPHPVAMKEPNELGLYDMCGNYSEPTNDEQKNISQYTITYHIVL